MSLRVLAIDPSASCTGWAFAEIGSMPITGTIRFADVGTGEDRVGAAALRWLTRMLNEHQPDRVAIEAPIRSPGGAASSSVFLLNLINSALRIGVYLKTGKSALIIAPSSARKRLTGKGQYPKGEAKPAVFEACQRLGWVREGDPYDISDALAIYVAAATDLDRDFAASFTPLGQAAEAV